MVPFPSPARGAARFIRPVFFRKAVNRVSPGVSLKSPIAMKTVSEFRGSKATAYSVFIAARLRGALSFAPLYLEG